MEHCITPCSDNNIELVRLYILRQDLNPQIASFAVYTAESECYPRCGGEWRLEVDIGGFESSLPSSGIEMPILVHRTKVHDPFLYHTASLLKLAWNICLS